MDKIAETIINTLAEKIVTQGYDVSRLTSDIEYVRRESNERLEEIRKLHEISKNLKEENKRLKEELEISPLKSIKPILIEPIFSNEPLDLETPEGYYQSLGEIPFVEFNENYFVTYENPTNRYIVIHDDGNNNRVSGMKYISKEDAEKFCKKFNKGNNND